MVLLVSRVIAHLHARLFTIRGFRGFGDEFARRRPVDRHRRVHDDRAAGERFAHPGFSRIGAQKTTPPPPAGTPPERSAPHPAPDALMLIGSALPAPAPAARANATGAGIVNHVAPRSSTSAIDPSGCSRGWSPLDPQRREV